MCKSRSRRENSSEKSPNTHLKTDRRPRRDFLLGCGGACSLIGGVRAVVGPMAVIGQGPRPPIEHEPSLQPLAAASARVIGTGTGKLFQIATA